MPLLPRAFPGQSASSHTIVVCTLTGHGLEDLATAMATAASAEPEVVDATMEAVRAAVGL